jgi:CDP-glucose 4,6-dehydratase
VENRTSAVEGLVIDRDFWSGRKVFITGHTGFKGAWLCVWLESLGAHVSGYALEPPTTPSLFDSASLHSRLYRATTGDVRNLAELKAALRSAEPEIVFHLAAQPLVIESYRDPVGTYQTNIMGTVNLFEAVRSSLSVRAVVNVTTDKVYENREWVWGYRENDPLGGYDPYSNSKACSELVTSAYRNSFFNEAQNGTHRVAIATARSGNVVGGGDWARDRLVPDCIRAFSNREKILIRYPQSTRPWQHVLEALAGYMKLARSLVEGGARFSGAWNFSPDPDDARSVAWVVEKLGALWGRDAGYIVDAKDDLHEAAVLALDNAKAREYLGWKPRWDIEEALALTVQWFSGFHSGKDAYNLCRAQIDAHAHEADV